MSETSPQPNVGSDDEKDQIRRTVERLGLTGAANDVKWGRLLDAMRLRDDWTLSFRYKCVNSDYISEWFGEWWHHLPLPMMSAKWLDLNCLQDSFRGYALKHGEIDHSVWILPLIDEIGFCYDVVGNIVRVHGYLPKSFEGWDDLPKNQS